MIRLIKIGIFIFLLLFTTHSYGKSNEYYKQTLIHVLTECNSDCQKQVFKQEINQAIISLFEAILNQLKLELNLKKKEDLWVSDIL
jgi:predicted solute-binding protein